MAPCHLLRLASLTLAVGALFGCSPSFSPNTYNSGAVQQVNKAEQGVIVGVRQIDVSVAGTTGAVAGAAAGGIVGAQVPGSNTTAALGTVGGGLLGGLLGSGVEKATGNTQGTEYIVRKPNGELLSVTQVDKVPLALGQHVLVIAGVQARIVADYIVPEKPAVVEVKPVARPTVVKEATSPVGTAGTAPAALTPPPLEGETRPAREGSQDISPTP